MKPSRKISSSTTTAAAATTVTFTYHNNQTPPKRKIEIPIQSPSSSVPITSPLLPPSKAAARIQSAYRASIIRTLYKKIQSVSREADQLERLIQMQDTVDSIRSDDREKIRMNELSMSLLLRLDSVPGVDPAVREARRKMSRRIVGLQEIIDGISASKDCYGYDRSGVQCEWGPEGFWTRNYWAEEAEEELCRERGGDEMDEFCAQYLGFRCFQRFLRE